MQIHHVCWSHPTFCWFNRNFHTWNVSHHFWHFRSTGLKLAICFLSCGWQCLLGSIFNRGCDRDMDSSKSLPHHWRVLNGLYMDIFGTFSYIIRDNPIFFHIIPYCTLLAHTFPTYFPSLSPKKWRSFPLSLAAAVDFFCRLVIRRAAPVGQLPAAALVYLWPCFC